MKKQIAFLRGINVSGHKKIFMADLRELLTSEGFRNVQTYIQSGNILFDSETSAAKNEALISEILLKKYDWDVPVLVTTASVIEKILSKCPFSVEQKIKSYFTLLQQTPSEENSAVFNTLSFPEEEFHLEDQCVYFYSPKSAGRVKLNNNFIERKLQVKATTRNYRTLQKLLEMATE